MLASVLLACLLTPGEPEPLPTPLKDAFREPKVEEPDAFAPEFLTPTVTRDKVTVGVVRFVRVKEKVVREVDGREEPPEEHEYYQARRVQVSLSELKELSITTASGKKLTIEEAEKRISDGVVVLVAKEGKPVDPKYLKMFKNDVMIFSFPDLSRPVDRKGRRDT